MRAVRTFNRGALASVLLLSALGRSPVEAAQVRGSGTPKRNQITVKIRNGRTGLPVWLASPYVDFGNVDPEFRAESRRKTTLWSDAHIEVAGAGPHTVTVWVDFVHRDCRVATSDGAMTSVSFDLDLVLSKGVVTPNLCSSKTQPAEPGVITVWIIPSTFKELWNG